MKHFINNYAHTLFLCFLYTGTAYGVWYCYETGNWWLLLISYVLNLIHLLFANNIGMHRLFCHRSFKTQRWKEVMLAWWTLFLGGRGPIGWSGHPFIKKPNWGTANQWQGNIPFTSSLPATYKNWLYANSDGHCRDNHYYQNTYNCLV